MRNLKNSEAYHVAQIAVMDYELLSIERRLEVLSVLMDAERTEQTIEKLNEKETEH